jgi:hypothetical protein
VRISPHVEVPDDRTVGVSFVSVWVDLGSSDEGWGYMESREDCLREATECDRLAKLANTQATRALLAVAAFQWRKLAEKAVERQKPHWPFVSEAIRLN